MNPAFLTLIAALISDAPHLVPMAIQTYGDIAHGEGGGQKVAKVFTDIAAILTGGVAIASTVQPAPANNSAGIFAAPKAS